MPRQPQRAFDEVVLEDAEFFEALKTLERFKVAEKREKEPVKKAREKSQDRVDRLREQMNVEQAEEVVEARKAALLAAHKAGTLVRVYDFQVPVEEYTTIEKVEGGKGVRIGRIKRVQGEMEPLLA